MKIPFAPILEELLQWEELRARRDFPRLLSLIEAHACLHQYQRSSYEDEGRMVVVAELEDYRRVYEYAESLFTQATKRLTIAQERVLKKILENPGLWEQFGNRQAEEWVGSHYSTVVGHLKDLEKLGMVESGKEKGLVFWRVVSEAPKGVELPTPEQVHQAMYPQTPRTGPTPSSPIAGTFPVSYPVSNPGTPRTSAIPNEDAMEI